MSFQHVAMPLLVSILSLGGCSDAVVQVSEPGDYIVFGDFYGECIGEGCISIFKASDGRIFKDTLETYPNASKLPHAVQLVLLSGDRYDEVLDLIGDIPAGLFDESNVVIGQPDAGDWGGFYLETNASGEIRSWLIDKMEDNLPEYLLDYTKNLDKAIQICR